MAILTLSFAGGTSGGFGFGHLIALTTAIAWSIYTVFMDDSSAVNFSVVSMCFGIGLGPLIIMHTSNEVTVIPNAIELAEMVYYAIFISVVPFFLWSKSIDRGNTVLLTTTSYIKPVLSILLLIMLGFTEATTAVGVASLLVILAGLTANDTVAGYLRNLMTADKQTVVKT